MVNMKKQTGQEDWIKEAGRFDIPGKRDASTRKGTSGMVGITAFNKNHLDL